MCIHMHIHTCIHIHAYIHIYVHTYIHTCIHTYIHTYILTYIHTYRIAGFCREDFNLAIGSIYDIKIHDHFIRDIL